MGYKVAQFPASSHVMFRRSSSISSSTVSGYGPTWCMLLMSSNFQLIHANLIEPRMTPTNPWVMLPYQKATSSRVQHGVTHPHTGLGLEVHTCMAGIVEMILKHRSTQWPGTKEDEICKRWVQTIICAIGTPSNPDGR